MKARVKKRTNIEVINTDRKMSMCQSLKVNQEWKMIDKGLYVILSRNGVRMQIDKLMFGTYFEVIKENKK